MKKLTNVIALVFAFLLLAAACGEDNEVQENAESKIYLYGEAHADEEIIEKEYELWHDYYYNHGMRHLFIEASYFTVHYMNEWMKSETDEIFEDIYEEWGGTPAHNEHTYNFYMRIKEECPETVFHGHDIAGTGYIKYGIKYLQELRAQGKEDSDEYKYAEKIYKLSVKWNNTLISDPENGNLRENSMAEEFMREFDALEGESVMGIYGAAHVVLGKKAFYGTVDNMGTQLQAVYGDNLYAEDLSKSPRRTDRWSVNGKEYDMYYYGDLEMESWSEEFKSREFWKVVEPESDFDDWKLTGEVLPYNNYPVNEIEVGDVFMVHYLRKDGGEEWRFYKADGTMENDLESTRRIVSPDSE